MTVQSQAFAQDCFGHFGLLDVEFAAWLSDLVVLSLGQGGCNARLSSRNVVMIGQWEVHIGGP